MIAQRQAIRGESRLVVALAFEGERLVQVIEALGLDVIGARAAEQAAPETHGPKIACGRSRSQCSFSPHARRSPAARAQENRLHPDRKSTRLNSSHSSISYAVFCLKKKTTEYNTTTTRSTA